MTIATERKAPWYTRDYPRIVSATHRSGVLTVEFADGSTARVRVEELRADPATSPNWDGLTHNDYEIVVPTAAGDLEIPWDVVRALTDPAFEQHLAASADASAKRIGVRIRELREGLRLDKPDLAERAGIPSAQLTRIEAGNDGISLPTLERIVSAMGYDMRVFAVDGAEEGAI